MLPAGKSNGPGPVSEFLSPEQPDPAVGAGMRSRERSGLAGDRPLSKVRFFPDEFPKEIQKAAENKVFFEESRKTSFHEGSISGKFKVLFINWVFRFLMGYAIIIRVIVCLARDLARLHITQTIRLPYILAYMEENACLYQIT